MRLVTRNEPGRVNRRWMYTGSQLGTQNGDSGQYRMDKTFESKVASLRRRALDGLSPIYRGKKSLRGIASRDSFESLDILIDDHFRKYSDSNHPCRETLTAALEKLDRKPAVILETGSSAWGANSSLLFDSYVNSFGGQFSSVDLRAEPMFTMRPLCSRRSEFACDDSVSFLKKFANHKTPPDLVYLDSWDVNWTDPLASALHGFHEFLVVLPLFRTGALLLVDDTPANCNVMQRVQPMFVDDFDRFTQVYGFTPGKGALIKNFLAKNAIGKQVAHDYQLLWEM